MDFKKNAAAIYEMMVLISCISVSSLIPGKTETLTVKTLVTLATGNTVLLDRFGAEGFDLFILPYERSQITLSM